MSRGSGITVSISHNNFKLDRYLKKALPGDIRAAKRIAMNATAKAIRVQVAKEIAPALKIKSSLIKQRIDLFYGKKYKGAVGVYFRHAPMPASTTGGKAVGKSFVQGKFINQKRGGVKVGGRTYKEGFVGRTRRGPRKTKLDVFKRDPSATNKVRRILVPLDSQKNTLESVGKRVQGQVMNTKFQRALRAKMKGYL